MWQRSEEEKTGNKEVRERGEVDKRAVERGEKRGRMETEKRGEERSVALKEEEKK